jgi:hypothetical protein
VRHGRIVERIKEETQGGVLRWIGTEPKSGGRKKIEQHRSDVAYRESELAWFREEIKKAHGGRAPRVLDPFAGGGINEFGSGFGGIETNSISLVARSELKPSEIQDLGDIIPKLLEIKNKANIPLRFRVQLEIEDGQTQPEDETVRSMNVLLADIKDDFQFE